MKVVGTRSSLTNHSATDGAHCTNCSGNVGCRLGFLDADNDDGDVDDYTCCSNDSIIVSGPTEN